MPISRQEFGRRWPSPVQRSLRWARVRAVLRLVDYEAATLVTWAAMVSAIGAAFVAVGLVEYSRRTGHSSPRDNGWTVSGLVLLVGASVGGLLILASRVASIVKGERWKAHVAQFARQGQLLRDRQRAGEEVEEEFCRWYQEVLNELVGHDPTGAVTVAFENPIYSIGVPYWERGEQLVRYLRELL
jgi:hypothetical protein